MDPWCSSQGSPAVTARLGPLRFAAAPLRDGTEPAGALVDELLRTGRAVLPLPELIVALLSIEQHTLAVTVTRRGRRAGLIVLAAACATCAATAWATVTESAPAPVRERLRSEPAPASPWCAALIDTRLLRTPADLWPHVERLGAAWQNAAFLLGFAPLTAADCTAANADEPPD